MADDLSRVMWKDEDNINGIRVGPVILELAEGRKRLDAAWVPFEFAVELAEAIGVPFEEA